MHSVLLLGGTGTLSSAVLQQALDKGFKVSIMNRGTNNIKLPKAVDTIICDFKDKERLAQTFSNLYFDVIVDFLSRTPNDIDRVYPIFQNICHQYIFISSACVYRRADIDLPIKETSPKPNTDWRYNIEKYECEKKLISLSKNTSSFYTIIRPYITYNDERIPLGITPSYKCHRTIIERLKSGKPWFTWDNGEAISTITHVEDFAVGVVGLFLNSKAKNEDFHITGDSSYTQQKIVEITINALNSNSNVVNISSETIIKLLPEFKSMLIGDRALDALFDNEKIKDAVPELKFSIPYHEGIERIIKYWKLQTPIYDYKFEARIDRMLSKVGVKTKYVQYPGASKTSKFQYVIYKYLPLSIANRLYRCL